MTSSPIQPREPNGRFGHQAHSPQDHELVAADPFTASGMSDEDAAAWRMRGTDADEAIAWNDRGFTPFEAAEWRRRWLGPDDAAQWNRVSADPKTASEYRAAGFSPEGARDWIREGFTASDAQTWMSEGASLPSDLPDPGPGRTEFDPSEITVIEQINEPRPEWA